MPLTARKQTRRRPRRERGGPEPPRYVHLCPIRPGAICSPATAARSDLAPALPRSSPLCSLGRHSCALFCSFTLSFKEIALKLPLQPSPVSLVWLWTCSMKSRAMEGQGPAGDEVSRPLDRPAAPERPATGLPQGACPLCGSRKTRGVAACPNGPCKVEVRWACPAPPPLTESAGDLRMKRHKPGGSRTISLFLTVPGAEARAARGRGPGPPCPPVSSQPHRLLSALTSREGTGSHGDQRPDTTEPRT